MPHQPAPAHYEQRTFIANFNLLCQKLAKNGYKIEPLAVAGVCDGLAKVRILYEKEGRAAEFEAIIAFINNLDSHAIERLSLLYQQKKNFWVDTACGQLQFEKILRFVSAIDVTQQRQTKAPFKSIGANWDDSIILNIPPNGLENALATLQLKDLVNKKNRFLFISSNNHACSMSNKRFYNSNDSEGAVELTDETILQTMAFHFERSFKFSSGHNFLCIDVLSYGDEKRELDDLLIANAAIIKSGRYKKIESLVKHYEEGNLARMPLALALQDYFKTETTYQEDRFWQSLKTGCDDYINKNQITTIEALMQLSEKPAAFDEKGNSWLFYAAQYRHIILLKQLIAKKLLVNYFNSNKVTPLMVACMWGHLEIVKILIANGAHINLTGIEGLTPLYLAIEARHYAISEFLITAGASVTIASKQGLTPIYLACQAGNLELVKLLEREGADVCYKTISGATPLFIAAENGHADIVQYLLTGKAKQDIETPLNAKASYPGATALHTAVHSGHLEVVKILITHGANIHAALENGATPLHTAISQKHLAVAKFLLENGANANAETNNGTVPLRLAYQAKDWQFIRLLLEYGAHFSGDSYLKEDILKLARQENDVVMIQFVTQYKAAENIFKQQLQRINSKDTFAERLGLLFSVWANSSSLLFFYVRNTEQKCAQNIAQYLTTNPNITLAECKNYVIEMQQQYNVNLTGLFTGFCYKISTVGLENQPSNNAYLQKAND